MPPISETVARNIQRHRASRGMSQRDLARAVKVKPQSVFRWETGRAWPTAKNVEALARVFGIASTDLFMPQKGARASRSQADSRVRDALTIVCSALGYPLRARKSSR